MKIGIDIGGNHISIAVLEGNNILDKREYEIAEYVKSNNEKNIKKYILELLAKGILELYSSEISKITIGCCGTIKKGEIIKATNLKIYNFKLVEELRNVLNVSKNFDDVEIILKNDAKVAASAEKQYGALKGCKDALFLTIGTGIGGACFINNKLLEPKRYSGFEYGHIIISANGKKCTCGAKGCFERYASMTALKEMMKKAFNIADDITGKELHEFIVSGLKKDIISWKIEEILDSYVKNLAIGISNLINIFEPQVVVLGGSIVYYEDILLKRLQENLFVFNREADIPEIKMAVLGNDAGLIGE